MKLENKVENNKKVFVKNKKLIIIIALLMTLIILIPIGYSLFSDIKKDEASLKVGEIKVELEEDWPEPGGTNPDDPNETYDEFGIKKYTKSVKGVSVADQDAYVRIRCIPIVEYYVAGENEGEGEWITAPVSQDKIVLAINTENWVQQGDYWYYKKILKGFKETEAINIDWQITELPSEISTLPIRTNVRVMLEYSQVTNNMWKSIFQIEDLPAEVERID